MASIIQLNGKWRVQIRKKGLPSLCKTFFTEEEAKEWAQSQERLAGLIRSGKMPNPAKELLPYQIAGVYLLFLGSKLQYIGRSVHIYRRLNDHHRSGMEWDHFKVYPCVDSIKAASLEQKLIDKLEPPMNQQKNFKQKRKTRPGRFESLSPGGIQEIEALAAMD